MALLHMSKREKLGSKNTSRLRNEGQIPGVIAALLPPE